MSGADPWPLDQGKDADLLLAVAHAIPPHPDRHVGVAVSGGGDSVALLHLMARACRHLGLPLSAITVDHRLREGSSGEAMMVARMCASMDVPHRTLAWDHGPVEGNLMDAARRARRTLIQGWARANGVTHIALGHTADDQAETFLMALSRAAGLDGLVGMRRGWKAEGICWSRPLLYTSRADLRAYLRRHGVAWAEDPTNDDARYERVRARKVLAALAPLGIDVARIGLAQLHLTMAKHALDDMLNRAVAAQVQETAGCLRVDRAGFDALPHDLQRMLLVAAVAWLSGARTAPRAGKQDNFQQAARDRRDATLHGCRLRSMPGHILLAREPRAVANLTGPTDAPWDTRWDLTGPHAPDLALRALGADGLRACKDWRATGLPREALVVTPAVWRGPRLVAAPLAGHGVGWSAQVTPSFAAFLLSH